MWVKCEPDLDQEERKYEPHNDVAHNSAMTLSLGQGYCKPGGVWARLDQGEGKNASNIFETWLTPSVLDKML